MCSTPAKWAFLLILLINYLICFAVSEDPVRLRTCCNLNPQSGPKNCGSATGGSNEISGHPRIANTPAAGSTGGAVWEVPSNLMSTFKANKFLLSTEKLHCSGGIGNVSSFPLNLDPGWSNITLYPSGYLLYQPISPFPTAGDFFHTSQYCINGVTDTSVEILTCKRHCTPMEPCIPKCCPPDTVYTKLDLTLPGSCTDPGPIKWTPRIFSSPNKQLSESDLKKIQPWYTMNPPHVWVGRCLDVTLHFLLFDQGAAEALQVNDSIRHRFREDGEILLWNYLARSWEIFKKTETYCVDGVMYESKPHYNHKEEETFMMTCPIILQPSKERETSFFYGLFASITCIFALITVIVYALLWEKQNVHGWTIMSHSTSVFFFFVFIATAHFTKNDADAHATFGCLFVATMAHYFFLSTFCWLTMISFDLWLTFRAISLSKGKGLTRFLGYSAFGWGVPLFIVCLSWTLDLMYKDDIFSEVRIPMYGIHMCYLTTNALGQYIYAPCTILMALNLIFFGMTTWKLYQFKKSTRFATKSVQKDRQSYVLFLKLFFVVGVLWVFEIISFVADRAAVKWYWQFFDSLNCLSPVAIFFIFVFKYDVINSLGEKYPIMKTICLPNMWLLGLWRHRKSHPDQESTALRTKNADQNTTMSKVSESSVAD